MQASIFGWRSLPLCQVVLGHVAGPLAEVREKFTDAGDEKRPRPGSVGSICCGCEERRELHAEDGIRDLSMPLK